MSENNLQDFVFERTINYLQSRGLDTSKVQAVSLPIDDYKPVMTAQFALRGFPERLDYEVFAVMITDYNIEQKRKPVKTNDSSNLTLDFHEGNNVYRCLVSPMGLSAKISEFKFPNASALT